MFSGAYMLVAVSKFGRLSIKSELDFVHDLDRN